MHRTSKNLPLQILEKLLRVPIIIGHAVVLALGHLLVEFIYWEDYGDSLPMEPTESHLRWVEDLKRMGWQDDVPKELYELRDYLTRTLLDAQDPSATLSPEDRVLYLGEGRLEVRVQPNSRLSRYHPLGSLLLPLQQGKARQILESGHKYLLPGLVMEEGSVRLEGV